MISAELVLAILFFLYQAGLLVWLYCGYQKMTRLPSIPPDFEWPTLSIIVPARNEERTIKASIGAFEKLNYPRLEIVMVNDRSTDRTGELIDAAAKWDSRIVPQTVKELPSGWLGKNHAMQVAAERANGEILLFTDADVVLDEVFLKKSIAYLVTQKFDHLSALPHLTLSDWKLYPVIGAFILGFSIFVRPWAAKDPDAPEAVGVGAFNLVKRKAYEAIGGHRSIPLRPDDDLKLAVALKRAGFKTDCVDSGGGVQVEWYSSLGELKRGLEKNTMTVFEYSFPLAIVGLFMHFFTFLFPFVLPWYLSGLAFRFALGAAFCFLGAYAFQLRKANISLWNVFLLPLGGILVSYILIRACWLTYYWGGHLLARYFLLAGTAP